MYLLGPKRPDLSLHTGEVPIAVRVGALRHSRSDRAELQPRRLRIASCSARYTALRGGGTRRCRRGLRRLLQPLGIERRDRLTAVDFLFLGRLDDFWLRLGLDGLGLRWLWLVRRWSRRLRIRLASSTGR